MVVIITDGLNGHIYQEASIKLIYMLKSESNIFTTELLWLLMCLVLSFPKIHERKSCWLSLTYIAEPSLFENAYFGILMTHITKNI